MEDESRAIEALLVVRAQLGDQRAFMDLVTRYQKRLLYYLRRFRGGQSTAEDSLQEVWLVALRKLGSLRDPRRFRSWLYGIARHKAMRGLGRRPVESLAEEPVSGEAVAESSFLAVHAENLHAALDRLPILHKEALVLRFLESMSYEELAEVLGCGIGTVKSRLHNAKRMLLQTLEEMADE